MLANRLRVLFDLDQCRNAVGSVEALRKQCLVMVLSRRIPAISASRCTDNAEWGRSKITASAHERCWSATPAASKRTLDSFRIWLSVNLTMPMSKAAGRWPRIG